MSNTDLLQEVKAKAGEWLNGKYDEETKNEIKNLLANNETELIECFYKDLEFGTGGLRGIMGVGTNRMNIYTVGMATQGLANYLLQQFSNLSQISVVVGHDSRNNSRLFAETTAKVFAANGIKVYLFDALRPTPELSFTIRHFKCQSGVVITASHNPKEYNGYKAYWDDGGQIIAPHDKNIISEVQKVKVEDVKFDGNPENIKTIGDEIDEIYTDKIKELSLSPEVIKQNADYKIVYTPIHGTGVKLVPMILKKIGFNDNIHVDEQDVVDGNFPTVYSPNPEETAALKMAIEKAEVTGADLVMATDPDSDRVGIASRDDSGKFAIINGNQTATLLIYYLLRKWQENGKLTGKEYIVKTIVTTDLLAKIADKYDVESYDVLTGFKFIADIIKQNEGKKTFIGGGEESYGYLAGEFVRDKDAVMSCALIAEVAVWAKSQGKSLYDLLKEVYTEYGMYKEHLISVVKKGKSGSEEIQAMMQGYRANPPATINNSKVTAIADYQSGVRKGMLSGKSENIDLPKSNVLQFFTEDGSKISVRPSGTEPKIKFYFSVNDKLPSVNQYNQVHDQLDQRIKNIIADMKLM